MGTFSVCGGDEDGVHVYRIKISGTDLTLIRHPNPNPNTDPNCIPNTDPNCIPNANPNTNLALTLLTLSFFKAR